MSIFEAAEVNAAKYHSVVEFYREFRFFQRLFDETPLGLLRVMDFATYENIDRVESIDFLNRSEVALGFALVNFLEFQWVRVLGESSLAVRNAFNRRIIVLKPHILSELSVYSDGVDLRSLFLEVYFSSTFENDLNLVDHFWRECAEYDHVSVESASFKERWGIFIPIELEHRMREACKKDSSEFIKRLGASGFKPSTKIIDELENIIV